MIVNKKGLSDVVTTVLIILLVLAAVAIIATYVLQSVRTGGEQIGGAGSCSALQLEPTSCTYVVNSTNATGYNVTVLAQKKGVDATVKELDVIFQKADGTTVIKKSTVAADSVSVPSYLETKSVHTEAALTSKLYSKVSTVTVITSDSGASVTCGETRKIECTGP